VLPQSGHNYYIKRQNFLLIFLLSIQLKKIIIIMLSSNKNCALSIELLPEFGWSIKNTPIYGPGSVFQGNSDSYELQLWYINHH
jgi:hypothetical protein